LHIKRTMLDLRVPPDRVGLGSESLAGRVALLELTPLGIPDAEPVSGLRRHTR
jgi:hypothetical protein